MILPIDMPIFYVTFGQRSPFRDGWVEIEALNREIAHVEAIETMGTKWSMLYDEQPDKDIFILGKIGRTLKTKTL